MHAYSSKLFFFSVIGWDMFFYSWHFLSSFSYPFGLVVSAWMEYKHQFKIILKSKKEEKEEEGIEENISFVHWSCNWLNIHVKVPAHAHTHTSCVSVFVCIRMRTLQHDCAGQTKQTIRNTKMRIKREPKLNASAYVVFRW